MTNKKRLGQRLLEKGLITGEELSEALLEQSLTGEKLGRVLVKLKMISESTLNELLGIKEMNPGEAIDQQLLRIIPEELIRRYKVFPVKKDKNRLYIAMADTLNVMAIDDLRLVTGLDIEPLVASEKEINALIEKNFGIPEVEKAMQELGIQQEPEEPEEEEAAVDEAPVIRLVNSIMIKAFDEEASDIHIEPFKNGIRVRYRVDGILREVMSTLCRGWLRVGIGFMAPRTTTVSPLVTPPSIPPARLFRR
jgi:type IV pilus assembly protein PilB